MAPSRWSHALGVVVAVAGAALPLVLPSLPRWAASWFAAGLWLIRARPGPWPSAPALICRDRVLVAGGLVAADPWRAEHSPGSAEHELGAGGQSPASSAITVAVVATVVSSCSIRRSEMSWPSAVSEPTASAAKVTW
jgi:hypothetical protein